MGRGGCRAGRRARGEGVPTPNKRAARLVGVPLAGTGDGGLRDRRGEVVDALVPALQEAARRSGVDVALVLFDEQDHAAVQARRCGPGEAEPGSRDLEAAQQERADELGRRAASGQLALFLGSGASIAAGLPTWKGLLQELGERPEMNGLDITSLTTLDAAQLAQQVLDETFRKFMQERFTLRRHALTHSLVAGLQVESVVTTNYDNGYELAASAVQSQERPLCVLPRQQAEAGSPWLLKMHGDSAHPESIVLTRQHYVEYGDVNAPLTGLVQSLLLTRHMLFVGFSLEDDNFARLAHQVRKLLKSVSAERRVGTVLTLREDAARERLWRSDLEQVGVWPAAAPGQSDEDRWRDEKCAARRLEIFLDRVAWRAAVSRGGSERYLLDERYDAMERTQDERSLREKLRRLERAVDAGEKATPAWATVQAALRALGSTPA